MNITTEKYGNRSFKIILTRPGSIIYDTYIEPSRSLLTIVKCYYRTIKRIVKKRLEKI